MPGEVRPYLRTTGLDPNTRLNSPTTCSPLNRKLSELVLHVVKERGTDQEGGVSSDGKVGWEKVPTSRRVSNDAAVCKLLGQLLLQVLDLSGDREPLTKETAEEALESLFAASPAITTVCYS